MSGQPLKFKPLALGKTEVRLLGEAFKPYVHGAPGSAHFVGHFAPKGSLPLGSMRPVGVQSAKTKDQG